MGTKGTRVVFLDTNVLYDFNAPEQILWLKELGADKVKLVLTQVVIRELNEHKDGGRRPALAERAGEILRRFNRLWEDNRWLPEIPLRDAGAVSLVAEWKDATVGPPLNGTLHDDQFIQNVCEYKRAHPDDAVSIFTNDLGMSLKARAFDIDLCRIDDKYKAPPAEDPRDKQLREYRKTLEGYERILRDTIPAVGFEVQGDNVQHETMYIKVFIRNEGSVLARFPAIKGSFLRPLNVFGLHPNGFRTAEGGSFSYVDKEGDEWTSLLLQRPGEQVIYPGAKVFAVHLVFPVPQINRGADRVKMKVRVMADRFVSEERAIEFSSRAIEEKMRRFGGDVRLYPEDPPRHVIPPA